MDVIKRLVRWIKNLYQYDAQRQAYAESELKSILGIDDPEEENV